MKHIDHANFANKLTALAALPVGQETLALLQLLAMSERDAAAGRVKLASAVVTDLRASLLGVQQ